jgi:uncharacterized integral membrane protein (TIGR00698 family)
MVLVQVPFVILTAMLLGKVFNINHKLSTLIGVGTAVCGTSAIVAIAPVIDSDESDAILSVSIVSFLGAIGVLAYSFINNFVHPNVLHYGIWSGISLHGVAHAIAAAVAGGDQSLKIATFVKMSRVVMLVPVSVILAGVFNKDNSDNNRAKFPMYVLYFIIIGLMNTFLTLPTNITGIFKTTSSLLIAMAMIAMGLSVDLKSIKNKGIQSITLATTVFIIISSLSYLVIYLIV